MNKRRRKALEEVVIKIQEAVNELENLREEEEEYRDNFPDNLLSCERYEIAENACYCLEEATQALEDAINNINESIEG